MGVDLDKWTEKVRRCEYLAEDELKALCEYVGGPLHPCCASHDVANALVCWSSSRCPTTWGTYLQVKEILVEESNVQPVNAPVTVRSGSAAPCCDGADEHCCLQKLPVCL
jgi:serine/threonine-protein phosphatase 6 catalytic subunit